MEFKNRSIGQTISTMQQAPAQQLPMRRNDAEFSCNAPIVGGFQIPLPGIVDGHNTEESEIGHDWHCYLGSR